MITVIFTIIAIINALMLLALLGVIYLKSNSLSDKYDLILDILVLSLLIGIVTAVVLSAFIII